MEIVEAPKDSEMEVEPVVDASEEVVPDASVKRVRRPRASKKTPVVAIAAAAVDSDAIGSIPQPRRKSGYKRKPKGAVDDATAATATVPDICGCSGVPPPTSDEEEIPGGKKKAKKVATASAASSQPPSKPARMSRAKKLRELVGSVTETLSMLSDILEQQEQSSRRGQRGGGATATADAEDQQPTADDAIPASAYNCDFGRAAAAANTCDFDEPLPNA